MEMKNICGKIPVELHEKLKLEVEELGISIPKYLEMVIEEHMTRKGEKTNMANSRTVAVQVDEELFSRLKAVLAKNGMKQKDFLIGLIEAALEKEEAKWKAEIAETAVAAELEETEPEKTEAAETETGKEPELEDAEAEEEPTEAEGEESEPAESEEVEAEEEPTEPETGDPEETDPAEADEEESAEPELETEEPEATDPEEAEA